MTKKTTESTPKKRMLQPIGARVLIKRSQAEDMSKGGIIIPHAAKERPAEGIVVAVGEGRLRDDGTRSPIEVETGDRVLFHHFGGTEIKIDGEEFMVLEEGHLIGVMR